MQWFCRKRMMILGIGIVGILAICGVWYVMYVSRPFIPDLPTPPADAPYRHANVPIDVRVDDLLSRMSLEEKIGQMALVDKGSLRDTDDIVSYGLGALLSGAGAKPENNTVEGWKEMVAGYMNASRRSRLGIPLLYGIDANHGHSNIPGATIFPHFIGLGAAGNPDLVYEVARATGEELAATGIYWSYSPTLDLPKDIRWGRVYEAFSDDPSTVERLGPAYVYGLQHSPRTENKDDSLFILATAKHYIGLGSMMWGSSSNENFSIDQGVTPADEARLRGEYLQPFEAAIARGVGSVMVGLNSWGDTKLSASKYLISDVLKGELEFEGFVVSDWYSVYEIPGGKYRAAVEAVNAGVDMVMLPFEYQIFTHDIQRAVKNGDISESRIDDAVRRILTAKFRLGLFDAPRNTSPATSDIGTPTHRSLAREAVAHSLVLLKNDGRALPITGGMKHIRVAGSAADNVGMQMGAWSVEWQGVDGNWVPGATSILAGIRERVGAHTTVEYDLNGNFSDSALADIGIAVIGEKPYAEGWGDNSNPTVSEEDLATIEKLKASSKKVVVILVSGRPLFISKELPKWDAFIAAWLPGSEGAGVADVLFGDKEFRGSLPLPWPDHVEQLPIGPDEETADNTPPLFPRYYGLR